jgi:hypothetical protein
MIINLPVMGLAKIRKLLPANYALSLQNIHRYYIFEFAVVECLENFYCRLYSCLKYTSILLYMDDYLAGETQPRVIKTLCLE